jgi:hypothetical protein
MRRSVIIGVVAGILLVGLASAGLLSIFGEITNSFTIENPVFYTRVLTETIDNPQGDEVDVYLLSLEKKTTQKTFDIYINCTHPPGGCSEKFLQFFTTKELGLDGFYASDWDFTTEIKILNKSNYSKDCSLSTKLFKTDGEDGEFDPLGESVLSDNIPEQANYEDIETRISIPEIEMDEEERFYVEHWAQCDFGEYNLRLRIGDEGTRVEVSAV